MLMTVESDESQTFRDGSVRVRRRRLRRLEPLLSEERGDDTPTLGSIPTLLCHRLGEPDGAGPQSGPNTDLGSFRCRVGVLG